MRLYQGSLWDNECAGCMPSLGVGQVAYCVLGVDGRVVGKQNEDENSYDEDKPHRDPQLSHKRWGGGMCCFCGDLQ